MLSRWDRRKTKVNFYAKRVQALSCQTKISLSGASVEKGACSTEELGIWIPNLCELVPWVITSDCYKLLWLFCSEFPKLYSNLRRIRQVRQQSRRRRRGFNHRRWKNGGTDRFKFPDPLWVAFWFDFVACCSRHKSWISSGLPRHDNFQRQFVGYDLLHKSEGHLQRSETICISSAFASSVSNFQILCGWLSDLISLLVVLVTNHGSLRVYRGMTNFNDNSLATICCTSLKVTFRGLRRFVSIPPLHPRSICDTHVGVIDGREGR